MKFKSWLLAETSRNKTQITLPDSIQSIDLERGGKAPKTIGREEIKDLLHNALKTYFNRVDPNGLKFLSARVKFNVTKMKDSYEGMTFDVAFEPIGKRGSPEVLSPDHTLYNYTISQKGSPMTGGRVYKKPKDAISEIPSDPRLVYRGMAWEEWQSIRRKGRIESSGHWNLGDEQVGLTMFGMDPSTALSYAHGFAPFAYNTSFKRPSVIIAIPKELTLGHEDDPKGIPKSERAVKGGLPADKIVAAWMLAPASAKMEGHLQLIIKRVPAWDDKVYRDPRTGIWKLDPNFVETGSGQLSGIHGYNIRPLQLPW